VDRKLSVCARGGDESEYRPTGGNDDRHLYEKARGVKREKSVVCPREAKIKYGG